jgi:hypothetical protein
MGVFTLQITFVVKETKEFHKVLPSMEPFFVLDLLFHFDVIYNVTQTKDIKLGMKVYVNSWLYNLGFINSWFLGLRFRVSVRIEDYVWGSCLSLELRFMFSI